MEHKSFYSLFRSAYNLGNKAHTLLSPDDSDDPRVLAGRIILLTTKASSSEEFLNYFKHAVGHADSELDFFDHLQIVIIATELHEGRVLTKAHFTNTLYSDDERNELYFKQADCEFRLKKLADWTEKELHKLRNNPHLPITLFKWKGVPKKFIELLLTLKDRNWIDLPDISNEKLTKAIFDQIDFEQSTTQGSFKKEFNPTIHNAQEIQDIYQALFRSYEGPHFLGIKRNDTKALPAKAGAGRKRAQISPKSKD